MNGTRARPLFGKMSQSGAASDEGVHASSRLDVEVPDATVKRSGTPWSEAIVEFDLDGTYRVNPLHRPRIREHLFFRAFNVDLQQVDVIEAEAVHHVPNGQALDGTYGGSAVIHLSRLKAPRSRPEVVNSNDTTM